MCFREMPKRKAEKRRFFSVQFFQDRVLPSDSFIVFFSSSKHNPDTSLKSQMFFHLKLWHFMIHLPALKITSESWSSAQRVRRILRQIIYIPATHLLNSSWVWPLNTLSLINDSQEESCGVGICYRTRRATCTNTDRQTPTHWGDELNYDRRGCAVSLAWFKS